MTTGEHVVGVKPMQYFMQPVYFEKPAQWAAHGCMLCNRRCFLAVGYPDCYVPELCPPCRWQMVHVDSEDWKLNAILDGDITGRNGLADALIN